MQILEINFNKLEPRANTLEKRISGVEQDLDQKIKPRFNVLDSKIADLNKKLR